MRNAIGQADKFYMINDAVADCNHDCVHRMHQKRGVVQCQHGYCKWRISANYYFNSNGDMRVGPFPGNFNDSTFMAFDYQSIDVLCLEKLVLQDQNGEIDILEV